MINLFFFIFVNLQAAVVIEDIPQSYDEWDSYSLVEVLIRDDQFELAEKQLHQLQDLNKNTYYYAMIDLKKNRHHEAISRLLSLPQVPYKDLAVAYAGSNQFQLCVDSFNRDGELNSIENRLYAMCAENIKNYQLTFLLLNKFLDEKTILQKILFLKKLNLLEEAKITALNFIQTKPSLSQALNLQTHFINDQVILEALRLVYPDSREVLSLWSHHQYKSGFVRKAAEGYEMVGWLGEKDLFFASAELWRSIGFYRKSEQLGLYVGSDDQKLRLKLSLAIDEENYAEVVSLSGAYSRSLLLRDQDLLYAFCYSFYQMGEYERARFYKAQITRSDLIQRLSLLDLINVN